VSSGPRSPNGRTAAQSDPQNLLENLDVFYAAIMRGSSQGKKIRAISIIHHGCGSLVQLRRLPAALILLIGLWLHRRPLPPAAGCNTAPGPYVLSEQSRACESIIMSTRRRTRSRRHDDAAAAAAAAQIQPAATPSCCCRLLSLNDQLLSYVLSTASARDLGRLAQTCRQLSSNFPAVLEDAARLHIGRFSARHREMLKSCRLTNQSASPLRLLQQLERLARPLRFEHASHRLEISAEDTNESEQKLAATVSLAFDAERLGGTQPLHTAVCADCASSGGKEYVEFTLVGLPSDDFLEDEANDDVWYEAAIGLAPRDLAVSTEQRLRTKSRLDAKYQPPTQCENYWGIQWIGGYDDYAGGETDGYLLHNENDELHQSIWNDYGEMSDGQYYPAGSFDEWDGSHSSVSHWAAKLADGATWRPKEALGQKLGLLWDADEGLLTVFENGKRKGIANSSKWIDEIKGELCWTVTLRACGPDFAALDREAERIGVQVERRPIPQLSDAEAKAEAAEKRVMAKKKADRLAEVKELIDNRDFPKCPGCLRLWEEIPDNEKRYCGYCECGCCDRCCSYM
jgi:hypothetical protein